MITSKYILIPALTTSLLVLAGCTTQTPTNTNTVTNANTINGNTNTTVSNDNTTNESGEGEIDTSDWQTYTNEEYGLSFKYPEGWSVIQEGANGYSKRKIYLYSKQNGGDSNGHLVGGETKIDIAIIISQNDFLTESTLCQRQYSSLKKEDYEIRCNMLQSNGLSLLEIETEIFPEGELPGDSMSLLYTHSEDKPFQIIMHAYFGSSDALYSSDRIVVEGIFLSMQVLP